MFFNYKTFKTCHVGNTDIDAAYVMHDHGQPVTKVKNRFKLKKTLNLMFALTVNLPLETISPKT